MNALGYVFNLASFVLLCLLVAVFFLKIRAGRGWQYVLFAGLGLAAVLTLRGYLSPPERLLPNTSRHALEHLGFGFRHELVLADDRRPADALWDTKPGLLRLQTDADRFRLTGDGFEEPIFFEENGAFSLANPALTQPVRRSVSFRFDTLTVRLLTRETEDGEAPPYRVEVLIRDRPAGVYPVTLRQPLAVGMSVGGVLARTEPLAPLPEPVAAALDSVWLLRSRFVPGEKATPDAPLVLFAPPDLWANAQAVAVDDQPVPPPARPRFSVALQPEQRFFFGLWGSRNREYELVHRGGTGEAEWRLRFPERKSLKRGVKPGESLFLTSSAAEVTRNEQLAGFYFPWFRRDDNRHHVAANLGYADGPARERLSLNVLGLDQNDLDPATQTTFAAGDTLRLPTARPTASRVHWLFRTADLGRENPLGAGYLLGFALLLTTLVLLTVYLNPDGPLAPAEAIAYVLLLALLTVRSVLLWRVSTYLPTDDVTAREFAFLRGLGLRNFAWGAGGTVVFFGLVWAWKWRGAGFSAWLEGRAGRISVGLQPKSLLLLGLYALPFLAKKAAVFFSELDRLGSVLLPVAVYFFIEGWALYQVYRAGSLTTRYRGYRVLTALNALACLGYLAFFDAGFGVVFGIGLLLYALVRQLTFPDHQQAKLRGKLTRFVLTLGALLLVLTALAYVMAWVFEYTIWVVGVVGVGLLGLAWAWRSRAVVFGEEFWLKPGIPARMLAALALGILVATDPLTDLVQSKKHMKYRAEVLIRSADEVMAREAFRFGRGDDAKLLEAAQNQWIIQYFYEKGRFSLTDYFRLVPHFKKGSTYLTQISDLVATRYLISEHTEWVVVGLLLLMLLLLLAALGGRNPFNWAAKLRAQLLCLLFAVGFFIWLAATNRTVFLGQDFPLLSLNSKLTVFFTFGLLLAAVVLGGQAARTADAPEYRLRRTFNPAGTAVFFRIACLVLALGVGLFWVFGPYNANVRAFNLDGTARQLATALDGLNPEFREFQQTRRTQNLPALVGEFDRFLEEKRQNPLAGQPPFVRSAYAAFRTQLALGNRPDQLIHLRRDADGFYEFAVNRLFYNVYSPDAFNEVWQGHVLAARGPQQLHLRNRGNGKALALPADGALPRLAPALASAGLTDSLWNQNLRLTALPPGWTADSLPRLLVSRTSGDQAQTQTQFGVKSGPRLLRSRDSDWAVAVQPGDVVQVQPTGGRATVTLQFSRLDDRYLAKNVWLNGKPQFFYPLGEKFLWAYHFANLVKADFDRRPDQRHRTLRLALDADLTETVYDRAAAFFREDAWQGRERHFEAERAFNLVVLDGEGRIRGLCDFKKGDRVRLDPNHLSDYRDLLTDLYLNARQRDERLLFGNRCLLRMDNGPASTFKPILYAAVTSQFNLGWSGLQFQNPDASTVNAIGTAITGVTSFSHFGGRKVKFDLEKGNLDTHGNRQYLSKSTNSYNSLVVFLGSLDREQLVGTLQHLRGAAPAGSFLARGLAPNPALNFPVFRYANQPYRIARFPASWSNRNSLMAEGLWTNFNLPVLREHLRGPEGRNLQNPVPGLDDAFFAQTASSYRAWSFPEPSHLLLVDRDVDLFNAIVQVSRGAYPVNITPLKMAEMTGSLFSFNQRFRASLFKQRGAYQPFAADRSWPDAAALSRFFGESVFAGMHESVESGTAQHLLAPLRAKWAGRYQFYAKTGTISGGRFRDATGRSVKDKRDKHLMLVISQNPLHDPVRPTPADLRRNRFYVLYFSFYNQSSDASWGRAAAELPNLVEAVMASPTFKSYMP